MNARIKNQIGLALLGAVLFAIGLALKPDDEPFRSYGPADFFSSAFLLVGVGLLVTGGGALILGLIRARDDD